jgi:hypothetical protein
MGNPLSNNNYTNGAVTNFVNQVNSNNYGNVANCFVLDSAISAPATIGIAHHGPNFSWQAGVTTLFKQLFTSFKSLTLTEETSYAPRLYSLDNLTLQTVSAVMSLTGTFQSAWFLKGASGVPDSTSHYSKPLSDITPQPNNLQFLKGRHFFIRRYKRPNPADCATVALYGSL